MKRLSDAPKGEFSKGVIVLIVALNVVFTAAVLVAMNFGVDEPTQLINRWFDWTTVEILVLFGIKVGKIGKDVFTELFDALKTKYGK
jgi:glutaredoxin-related protein